MKKMMKKMNIPVPSNMSTWWNIGSIMSITMVIQISTGTILSMNYNTNQPFKEVMMSQMNSNFGWTMRMIHSNTVSMIFIMMYMHIMRSMYYNLNKKKMMWTSGTMMMMTMMMISFTGYILPWSQMSYWGAMVITNLFSSIPMMGKNLTKLMWGNFSMNQITLNRMAMLHFLTPMMMMMMMITHMMILHSKLSNNPLGTKKMDFISLNPTLTFKDTLMMMTTMNITMNMIMITPMKMNNHDNFNIMNQMLTPNKIEPEWYFMFFYSILRSTPSKTGGIILMISSMMIMMMMPMMQNQKIQSSSFYPINKKMLWINLSIMMTLTLMGSKPIEQPYTNTSKILMMMFFTSTTMQNPTQKTWDKSTN